MPRELANYKLVHKKNSFYHFHLKMEIIKNVFQNVLSSTRMRFHFAIENDRNSSFVHGDFLNS